MKPARDPFRDYAALVRSGFERCAHAYASARRKGGADGLAKLVARLDSGAHVLDLGCGSGVPITAALAERYRVTGIDFSSEMIRLARRNVRGATFVEGDIRSINLPESSFDAVVAFYVIFHVPRDEQVDLLRQVHHWLRPGGYLLATTSASSEAGYTEDDFFGVSMYWSNFSQPEYEMILRNVGFVLVAGADVGHGYGSEHVGRAERHPVVLAQKDPQSS
jgi:ubiquinone/menaquinone biosynthesis C-methylase UbiE